MNWRVFDVIFCLAALLGCFFSTPRSHALSDNIRGITPNILFLFTDDQPANCTGYSGNEAIKTPHLDALARRGTVFTNAFVTTAICCSNRACILTGQTMKLHGVTDFRTPLSKEAFAKTYPAILRKSGYRTGYLGKFAIGNPKLYPAELALPNSDFDFWYGFPQDISYKQTIDGKTRFLTEVMTEKAIEFLETNDERPFCLTVAFKEPHGPFDYFDPHVKNPYSGVDLPPSLTFTLADFEQQPAFIQNSLNGSDSRRMLQNTDLYQDELRTFYRSVTRADQAVGEILAALKRLGFAENTVVIFSSDHGSLLGDHGLTGKWLMYENSIRIPLIIFDPRVHQNDHQSPNTLKHSERNEIVLSIDLAPTILSLAGVSITDDMEGRDLMPLVQGQLRSWRSHFYYEHIFTSTIKNLAPIPRTEGIRTANWKYVRYPDQSPVYEQLFDLENDAFEQCNLIDAVSCEGVANGLRAICDAESR